MITVKEMIEALQKLDPDTPVLVRGYESGFDEAGPPEELTVVKVIHDKYYDGRFQEAPARYWDKEGEPFQAIIIG